jgi:SAM-dependent methyltransferase
MESKTMNKDVPSWLGCPICQKALSQQENSLYCPNDDLSFPLQDGILRLMPPEQQEAADAFAAEYRDRREEQGWRSLTAEEMAALPTIPPGGWDKIYWPVRHKSYQVLIRWFKQNIDGHTGPLRVVDMGAGVGWLAGRLAMEANELVELVALDLSSDDAFGLGAAGRLRQELDLPLTLVQGDIEGPPFQRKSVDLLIYNASLHYAGDVAACLAVAADLLRPGGAVVIMDSPISTGPVTAISEPPPGVGNKIEKKKTGRSGRPLSNEEVVQALTKAGLTYEITSIWRGLRWQVRQLRMRLFGLAIFDLPIIIAKRV